MRLYEGLTIIAMMGIAAFTVFNTKPKTLEGTVKEELGTAQKIVESSGAIFGNESIKFSNPTYGLVLETDLGNDYTIDIKENYNKPIYLLAREINKGDKVKIIWDGGTHIEKDRIGTTDSSRVKLDR